MNPFNRSTILVLIFTSIIQVLSSDILAQNDDSFTIYLVRHSEKDHTSENSSDLPLSECGEQRSKALSYFLKEVELDAVYSTDFSRTKSTALPTANLKDIEISLYNEQDINSLSNHLLKKQQHALVVGHSNTTGVLTGLLINKNIEDIELHIYDRIYQVVVCGDSRSLNLFHSNFECVK